MPSFEKSPPELVARFDAAAERFPDAQRRKMFGYPALFVGGNLVTGLFADSWMIRLGESDLEDLLAFLARTGVRPLVDSTYPLAEARAALGHLAGGSQTGKVVLEVAG